MCLVSRLKDLFELPSPTPQQGEEMQAMEAKYKRLQEENTNLQSIILECLESNVIPLPTTLELEKLSALEAQHHETTTQNNYLRRKIAECLTGRQEAIGGIADSLAENAAIVNELQSILGPQMHCCAPLVSAVQRTLAQVSEVRQEEELLVADLKQCLRRSNGVLDSELTASLKRCVLELLEASSSSSSQEEPLELSGDDLDMIDGILQYLDLAPEADCNDVLSENRKVSARPSLAVLRDHGDPSAGSCAERYEAPASFVTAPQVPMGEAHLLREDVDSASTNLEQHSRRPRRRHNVNGSTRARRRKERARQAAAAAAAALPATPSETLPTH